MDYQLGSYCPDLQSREDNWALSTMAYFIVVGISSMWLLTATTRAEDSKYDRRDAYFFATDSKTDDLLAQLLVNDSIQEKYLSENIFPYFVNWVFGQPNSTFIFCKKKFAIN